LEVGVWLGGEPNWFEGRGDFCIFPGSWFDNVPPERPRTPELPDGAKGLRSVLCFAGCHARRDFDPGPLFLWRSTSELRASTPKAVGIPIGGAGSPGGRFRGRIS